VLFDDAVGSLVLSSATCVSAELVSMYGIVGDGYGVCGIVMGWKGVRMWVWWMCRRGVGEEKFGVGSVCEEDVF